MGLKQNGVQVVSVEPGSFAEDINLQPGDVVVSINRQPVSNTDELKRLQGNLKPGDPVQFRVMRRVGGRNSTDWQQAFVAGTLPSGH
jgi:serine protease Do